MTTEWKPLSELPETKDVYWSRQILLAKAGGKTCALACYHKDAKQCQFSPAHIDHTVPGYDLFAVVDLPAPIVEAEETDPANSPLERKEDGTVGLKSEPPARKTGTRKKTAAKR